MGSGPDRDQPERDLLHSGSIIVRCGARLSNCCFSVRSKESNQELVIRFADSVHSSYYDSPAKPTEEPQPIIHDLVLNITFPYALTNPYSIPENHDKAHFPAPSTDLSESQKNALVDSVVASVTTIIMYNSTTSNYSKCKHALPAGKGAALQDATLVPDAMISTCKSVNFYPCENLRGNLRCFGLRGYLDPGAGVC